MGGMRRLVHGLLVMAMLASCGGSMATAPGNRPPNGGGTGVGGGAGGGNGGGTGGDVGGPAADSVTVTVGNNFFQSDRNGSANPAVDTVVAGGTVTWIWVNTGTVPHNVASHDAPSFATGPLETGNGSRYDVTFTAPGSYRYDCDIHGNMMTGVIVVVAR